MKRVISIIILAILIVNIVGFTVFLTGNQPSNTNTSSNSSNNSGTQLSGQTSNSSQNNNNNNNENKVSSSELAKHDTQSDCWIAYEGKVYDITAFLPKHPGSAAAISPYCGTSSEFEKAFSDQHGKSQVQTLIAQGEYKGDLD